MSEKTNELDSEQEYTPEEMQVMRIKMHNYYDQEIKFLKKQSEYEKLRADIEDHKYRGSLSMMKAAQLYAAAEQAQNEAESQDNTPIKKDKSKNKKNRKLKKDVV